MTRTLRHIVMGAATVPVLGRAGRICPLQDMHERKEHSRGIRSINGARTVAATAAAVLYTVTLWTKKAGHQNQFLGPPYYQHQ